MHKFKEGDEVKWYPAGSVTPLEKTIAKVIPQEPILPQYITEPAVLIFTDKTWAFSWNVWPK